jgi:uncharacterized protein (DUF305 family)
MTDVTGVSTPIAPPDPVPGAGRDVPSGPGAGGGDRPGRSGPALWQIIALVLALCGLAAVVGWRLGSDEPAAPNRTSVDVGFFQDMTTHHQQAITMALDYLRNGDDPRLLQMASEIVTYQSSEIGMMNTYLGQWGRDGDEPDKAMDWMGPPYRRDEMPGLATKAQMDALASARGAELNELFTALMINHHAGGVHMAAAAAKTAKLASTRHWAAAMDDGQRGEISEMNTWRTKHGLATIVPPLAEFTPPADTDANG